MNIAPEQQVQLDLLVAYQTAKRNKAIANAVALGAQLAMKQIHDRFAQRMTTGTQAARLQAGQECLAFIEQKVRALAEMLEGGQAA